MGFLVWKYCEENEEAICNYVMRKYHSQDAGQEKMTALVDAEFKRGYSLKLNTYLNQYNQQQCSCPQGRNGVQKLV